MSDRNIIVAMTYAVVISSIIVQGLTVGKLTTHFVQQGAAVADVEAGVQAESLR